MNEEQEKLVKKLEDSLRAAGIPFSGEEVRNFVQQQSPDRMVVRAFEDPIGGGNSSVIFLRPKGWKTS